MNNKEYVDKNNRKKLFLISDDIKGISGVAQVSKNIILQTAHFFNWVNLGGLVTHPDKGKKIDLSEAVNKEIGTGDACVIQYPIDGYGNSEILRNLIEIEKPEAIVFITDPRQYQWLFAMEYEIRTAGIKLIYINIWDETGIIPFYNYIGYASCDGLLGISKQTVDINKRVLETMMPELNNVIEYFPHGVDDKSLIPLTEESEEFHKINDLRKELFKDKEYDFIVFYNARNIRRKSLPDLIMGFKLLLDDLDKEKADKCVLLLHTVDKDPHGTDLNYVIENLLGDRKDQVVFDKKVCDMKRLNLLYNLSDVTTLISSNEGWGLSGTESMMSGTPIIVNVTGGMQDYCRFVDENDNWYTNNKDVPSNHLGTYKECGEWVFPIFPSNISIQGSIETPAIFDSRCSFFDIKKALLEVFSLSKEERKRRGKLGRDWLLTDEAMMSAEAMGNNFIKHVNKILSIENKRKPFEIFKTEKRKLKYTPNILPNK